MSNVVFVAMMSVFGCVMIYRGLKAIRTERFRGNWGVLYNGKSAVWFGRAFVVLGPLLIAASVARLVLDAT